ncbi:MAG: FtsX-like permease family protein [Rhodothermales bacterium]
MKGTFYVRYAARALYRNGQRSVLAVICIAFGVLSLVALQLLAAMLSNAFLVDSRIRLGGDFALTRDGQQITTARIDDLDRLRAEGLIGAYTLISSGRAPLLRTERSGHVFFISQPFGVDPESYPLLGDLRLSDPPNGSFAQAIAEPGNVVITEDLAVQHDLPVGARFTLTGTPGSPPIELHVGGIAAMTPNRFGSSVLYSLDTARLIANQPEVPVKVAALWGPHGDTSARLEQAGWTVERPPERLNTNTAKIFAFMLGGAGILGLLIGGIGVANTMHVVLARRMPEIATLKTLGYRRRDLLALFGIETVLLGLLGSALGIFGALLLARQLMLLLERNLPFLLDYVLDPGIIVGGLVTGVLTAVIFGLAAMVRASAVRPAVLLRNLRVRRSATTRFATVGLYGMLLMLFGILSSVILGSLVEGFGVVAAGLGGLVVLGLALGALLFVTTRIPLPGLPLLGMARRNLRHQPVRSISALVALFVGVFSIGFATATLLNAQQRAEARSGSVEGYNLLIFAGLEEIPSIQEHLAHHNVRASRAGYLVSVQTATASGTPLPSLNALEGRSPADSTWNVTLTEGTWSSSPNAAFLPAAYREDPHRLRPGDTLHVAASAGTATLRVAGFYRSASSSRFLRSPRGLLVNEDTALRLGGTAVSVTYTLDIAHDMLAETTDALGRALPQTLIVNRLDVIEIMNRTFRGLFLFVIAVAGLSFVAGAVLIANAVGLAMVERRRELGVLKAIGYTGARVLHTVLLENTILGILSGVAGIAALFGAMALLNLRFPGTHLTLTWLQALAVVGVAVALAMGSATLVAWHPTHLRPLDVLRNE